MVWVHLCHGELWQILVNKTINRVQMSPLVRIVMFVPKVRRNVMFPSSGGLDQVRKEIGPLYRKPASIVTNQSSGKRRRDRSCTKK